MDAIYIELKTEINIDDEYLCVDDDIMNRDILKPFFTRTLKNI